MLALLAILLVIAAALAYVGWHTSHQITRIPDVFSGLGERPARSTGAAAGALNVLLLGTDRRSDVPTTGSDAQAGAWEAGAQRSDTMMVLHLSADRRNASLVSIPRDSWVPIPGHGTAKINAAYSWGGPRLAVATVEQLTGLRIDHLAVVDWDGYKAMIDALGGIDVTVPKTVYDSYRKQTWTAGVHHLDGAQALLYARERSGLPGGDLDRVKRQQAVLRALSGRTLAAATNPWTAYRLVNALTQHLSVDAGWSTGDLVSLLTSVRHLSSSAVSYLTIPTAGTGMTQGQSVVWVDRAESAPLWKAIGEDRFAAWAAAHPSLLTRGTVR
ncbi:LCP family protein [Nocardioides sp.]|uniref:LCP family protein n=1 Tax=Nocardioides sp. TaxID=35761 RepID=UPI0026346FF4|nr:LCP family protein [Nocardioides sp.]